MGKIRDKRPDLLERVLGGDISLKDAERTIRREQQAGERAVAADAARRAVSDETYGVIHGDCRSVAEQIEPGSVSLVLTDPPYHDATIGLYKDLGQIAHRVLRDGGSLITYIAQHRLPEIIAMLQASGLIYVWPFAITLAPPHARMREMGIIVQWKPLLWFGKAGRRLSAPRWVIDCVDSPRREKDSHPWQQNLAPAKYYIEALTNPGDLVFDPFCGGGTTAVAAAQTLRRWITCDTDETAVHISRDRIRKAREAVA